MKRSDVIIAASHLSATCADLIEKVRRGEMRPEEADALAVGRGGEPLARRPPDDACDPMAEPWWDLAQTAAWIGWRSPSAVREASYEYRAQVRVWEGPMELELPVDLGVPGGGHENTQEPNSARLPTVFIGHDLVRLSPMTLSAVFADMAQPSAEGLQPRVTPAKVRAELFRQLRGGTLVAEACPWQSEKRTPIAAAEWLDLDYYDQVGWPTDAVGVQGEAYPRYYSLRVKEADVRRIWPGEMVASPYPGRKPAHRPDDPRQAATRALRALFPPVGFPPPMKVAARTVMINDYLRRKGEKAVSERTITRALNDIASISNT